MLPRQTRFLSPKRIKPVDGLFVTEILRIKIERACNSKKDSSLYNDTRILYFYKGKKPTQMKEFQIWIILWDGKESFSSYTYST